MDTPHGFVGHVVVVDSEDAVVVCGEPISDDGGEFASEEVSGEVYDDGSVLVEGILSYVEIAFVEVFCFESARDGFECF